MNPTLILEAAVRSLLVGIAVWMGMRAFRVSQVAARKAAWALVLVASLAMPFLMRRPLFHAGLSFVIPTVTETSQQTGQPGTSRISSPAALTAVPPKTPAPAHTARTAHMVPISAATATNRENMTRERLAPMHPGLAPTLAAARFSRWTSMQPAALLRSLVVPVYLAVSAFLFLRLLVGLAIALRIWSRAERASPILEPRATVRISSQIDSPVTMGSGIVLPASYEAWDRTKQRIVLAHERSHVRQGDFYLQTLARLHTAIFWFSPLGWLLQKELSDLGEAIADRAALEEASSRPSYAELLLEFATRGRRPMAGVAMARSSNLHRRIDRLLTDSAFQRAFASARRHALLAVLLVPAAVIAATSFLHVQAAESLKLRPVAMLVHAPILHASFQPAGQSAPPAPAAPPTAPAPVSSPAPAPAAGPQVPAIASAVATPEIETPDAPEAPDAPDAPEAEEQSEPPAPPAIAPGPPSSVEPPPMPAGVNGVGFSYTTDDDGHDSYAIINGDHSTYSGSWGFSEKALKLRDKLHGPYILVEHDGKTYVIDDPSLLAESKRLWEPMEELGKQQAELGKQQAVLGEQQAHLGKLQAEVTVPPADLQRTLEKLDAELKALNLDKKTELHQEDLAQVQERIAQVQDKLGSLQGMAGDKQSKLGEQQSRLGEQQSKLGEQQSRIGEQQGRLADQARSRMHSLLDQAIHDGKARPVE